MKTTIEVRCDRCGYVNRFLEEDLVSGMSIKDDENKIIELHPKVEIDENTFILCEGCKGPACCADYQVVDE